MMNGGSLYGALFSVPRVIMRCGYEPTEEEIVTANTHCPNEGLCGFRECIIVGLQMSAHNSLPIDMRQNGVAVIDPEVETARLNEWPQDLEVTNKEDES